MTTPNTNKTSKKMFTPQKRVNLLTNRLDLMCDGSIFYHKKNSAIQIDCQSVWFEENHTKYRKKLVKLIRAIKKLG